MSRISSDEPPRTGASGQGDKRTNFAPNPPRRPRQPSPSAETPERNGIYEQAALLLEWQALQEGNPDRAALAHDLARRTREFCAADQSGAGSYAKAAKEALATQYKGAVSERLRASGRTLAQQQQAKAVLWEIVRHLARQSCECTETAAALCEISGIKPPNMAETLKLLEEVGAIRRMKRGRLKVIMVTPELACRNHIMNFAPPAGRTRFDVIDGGKHGPETRSF